MDIIKTRFRGGNIMDCLGGFNKKKDEVFSLALDIKKMISETLSAFSPVFKFIIDLFLFISFIPLIPFFYIIAVGIYTGEYIGLKLQKL